MFRPVCAAALAVAPFLMFAGPASAAPAPQAPQAKAAAAAAAPKMTTMVFQVDRYMPRTRAQANAVNMFADDGMLDYREDRIMWNRTNYQFVTVKVPTEFYRNSTDDDFYRVVATQINKQTNNKRIGDILTTLDSMFESPNVKAGKGVTVAWMVDTVGGASVNKPWGPKLDRAQAYFGRSLR